MNLIKLAARGPALWAPEPVSQQPGLLRTGLGDIASCLTPVILAIYIPSPA